jgi:hypothetical protein
MCILHYGHLDFQSGHLDFEQWLGQDNPRRPVHLCIVWGLKREEKAIKYVGSCLYWEQIVLKLQSLPLGERNGLLYSSQFYDSQDSLEKWWWELCHLGGPRIQSCRGTCLLSWLPLRSHSCMLVVANLVERGETSFQAEWNSVCKLDSICVDHQFWWTWASTSLLDNILPSCNTWQAKHDGKNNS